MYKKMVFAVVILAAMTISLPLSAGSKDAVEADPGHYTVEYENDELRVIRIKYGPGEKSVMHTHGPNVSVMITDGKIRFNLPDGSTQDASFSAGDTAWSGAEEHLPENMADKPFEGVLIELKD
jgi:quercetin dioxygenase-like cupin family protein